MYITLGTCEHRAISLVSYVLNFFFPGITWLSIRRTGKVDCTMSSDSLCDVCNVSIQWGRNIGEHNAGTIHNKLSDALVQMKQSSLVFKKGSKVKVDVTTWSRKNYNSKDQFCSTENWTCTKWCFISAGATIWRDARATTWSDSRAITEKYKTQVVMKWEVCKKVMCS
jgi:hypothetical protein